MNGLIYFQVHLNHSNSTCKNVLRVKLLSVNSTFAANYQYLSFKFGLTEADWYTSFGQSQKENNIITSTTIIMWCP